MARIQENVELGPNIDNLMAKLISVIIDLDWIVLEEEKRSLRFREKSRFDHYSCLEGTVEMEGPTEYQTMKVELKNRGSGFVQSEYLKGKMDEFLSRLADLIPVNEGDSETGSSITRDMENLSRLHREGELSDEEFSRAKEKILES